MKAATHQTVLAAPVTVASVLAILAILALAGDVRGDLFAVTDRGELFWSTNSGASWSLRGAVSEPSIAGLTPGPSAGTLYLAGTTGDVYRSVDAGASWIAAGNAGAPDCEDIVIDRSGDLLVLTRSGDFIRSADGGSTWTPESNAGFSDGVALAIGAVSGGEDEIFAITSSGDAARSVAGQSWDLVGNTGYTPVVDAAWSEGVLRAMTDAGELLVSSDAGASWSAAGTVSQVGMRAFTIENDKLIAITKEGDVAESGTGASWSWIGTVNQVFVVALAPGVPEFSTGVGGGPAVPQITVRAFPNPFTEEIRFALSGIAAQSRVEVAIFDTAGRRVARIHSGVLSDADPLRWRPQRVAAGIYLLRVSSDRFSETQRIVLIR